MKHEIKCHEMDTDVFFRLVVANWNMKGGCTRQKAIEIRNGEQIQDGEQIWIGEQSDIENKMIRRTSVSFQKILTP